MAIAQLVGSLELAERINQHFLQPKSNRGFQPAEFIKVLMLTQHEDSFHLDNMLHSYVDEALRTVIALDNIPGPPH